MGAPQGLVNSFNGTVYDTLAFDGSTNIVTLSPPATDSFGGALSVVLYLSSASFAANTVIFTVINAANVPVFTLAQADATGGVTVSFRTDSSAATQAFTRPMVLVTTRMQRLAVTVDSTGLATMVVDGQIVYPGSFQGAGPVTNVTNGGFTAYVGGSPLGGALLSGAVADVQVYSYALSSTALFNLYQNSTANCPPAPAPPPRPPRPPMPPGIVASPPAPTSPPPWFVSGGSNTLPTVVSILQSPTGGAVLLKQNVPISIKGAVTSSGVNAANLAYYGGNTLRVGDISIAQSVLQSLPVSSSTMVIVGVDLPSPATRPDFYRPGQAAQRTTFRNSIAPAIQARAEETTTIGPSLSPLSRPRARPPVTSPPPCRLPESPVPLP